MQPDLAYDRFTDRDVREDPDLASVAYEFVYNYGGDFDFLVQARNYAQQHGRLSVTQARGVLNCMRSDYEGLHMLARRSNNLPRPLRIVEKQRPAYIDLPSTWHYDYYMSTYVTAQVVHILDRQRSCVRWYPHVSEFKLMLYTCKPVYYPHYVMLHEVPTDRRLCRTCVKRRSDSLAV
jgi:hypothetical protein